MCYLLHSLSPFPPLFVTPLPPLPPSNPPLGRKGRGQAHTLYICTHSKRYEEFEDGANQNQDIADDDADEPHVEERHDLVILQAVVKLLPEEAGNFSGEFPGSKEGPDTLQDGDDSRENHQTIQNSDARIRKDTRFCETIIKASKFTYLHSFTPNSSTY